jgi:hypothetical protein
MKKLFTTLSVLLIAASAMAQLPSYVPTNGLLGYWPFNGNANDVSVNGNNGTANGVTLSADRFGTANSSYFFDGVNDNVLLPNMGLHDDFTISGFINAASLASSDGPEDLYSIIGDNNGWTNPDFHWHVNNAVTQAVIAANTPLLDSTFNLNNCLNQWVHVACTYETGQYTRMFINGQQIGDSVAAVIMPSLEDLAIGSQFNNSRFWHGHLDDFGIWNRVLSQQEIVGLCLAGQDPCLPSYVPTNGLVGYWPFCGNAIDESGNGNDGTVNGATLTTDRFGDANAAYDFDGEPTTKITMPSVSLPPSVTASAWVYVRDFSTFYPHIIRFWSSPNTSTAPAYALMILLGNNISYIQNGIVGLISGEGIQSNQTCEDSAWYHIVAIHDHSTSNSSLYLNGQLENTASTSSYLPAIPLMMVGNSPDGFNGVVEYGSMAFDGTIDDIGIWNRALTEQEILDLYNSCPNPITATITPNGSTTFCAGGFAQLTASTGDSYLWSNGETTQTITATQADAYTVTVTNNDGCTDTSDPVTVTVNPTPNSGVTVGGATTFCSGGSVTLTSQASSGSYLWNNGETTQSITVNQTGNYSVTVTENGCSATSGATAITVNQTPTATIIPQGSTTFCDGGFVVLEASGGGTYQWNTGAQASSINVSQSGTYTVIVTDNGCTDQTSQLVTVNPLPTVTLAPFSSLCENGAVVQLSGGSPSGGYYSVNGNPTPELNPITYGVGSLAVEYVYADSNSCVNTSSPQSININAMPSVSMSGLNTSYTLTDPFSILTGTPSGGVFNGTGMVSNYFEPSEAGLGTHGIAYIYSDGNGCIGSDAQCTTVDISVNIGGSSIGTDGGIIDVYPNPSNGIYSITVDGIDGIINMIVYDSRGREVITESMVANGQKTIQNIDLGNYANGVYTLSIRTGKGTTTQKLVKE